MENKEVFILAILFAFIIGYLCFVFSFIGQIYLLALIPCFYIMFFVTREHIIKKREFLDSLKIKDTKQIRIDFW